MGKREETKKLKQNQYKICKKILTLDIKGILLSCCSDIKLESALQKPLQVHHIKNYC